MMDRDIALSAYLDGELAPAERRTVEDWLAQEPAYRAELAALERTRTMVLASADQSQMHGRLMEAISGWERGHRRRRIVPALVAAAAVLLVALGLSLYLYSPGQPEPVEPGQLPAVAVDQAPHKEPPLETAEQPEVPVTDEPEAEAVMAETTLPLELVGIVRGARPMAIITVGEGAEKKQNTYAVGDTVMDGVVLHDIEANRVVLQTEGKLETLSLGGKAEKSEFPDLRGLWDFNAKQGDSIEAMENLMFKQESTTFTIYDQRGNLMGKGEFSGHEATVGLGPEVAPLRLEGEFDADWNRLTLEFASSGPDEPIADDLEGMSLEFVRVSADTAKERGDYAITLSERKKEAEAIAAALSAHAKANQGKFPGELQGLFPRYATDKKLLEETDERTFEYHPQHSMPLFFASDEVRAPSLRDMDESLPYPERLMALERALVAADYRQGLFPVTVLEVDYTEPAMTFLVDTLCRVKLKPQDEANKRGSAAVRASCQNNLKQWGLVIKMFEIENHGYTPPGICSVYPEYLSDPSILTSPKDPAGTDSYLYILPATHLEDYCNQMAPAEDYPLEVARGISQSQVPIMLNKTNFPEGGRNVLFADGHVEYVRTSSEQWKNGVEPYIKAMR